MLGFARWLVKGSLKNAQFWAFITCMVALVASLGGCPVPIPMYITIIGVAISFTDLTVSVVSYYYDLYKLEQKQIVRELSRK